MENNPLAKLVVNVTVFIDSYLVPVLFSLALVLFLFGVFRYFLLGGGNEEKRQQGKTFIMWGLIAMAVMVAVWGLVNILVRTFGLENSTRPCLPTFSGKCNSNGVGGGARSTIDTSPLPVEPVNPNNPGGKAIY
ncbi:MAG TPA: hypothetical protein VGB97_00795 [Candidatus Paceibacterota bacterium]|jgi:hypothetical protein